MVDPKRVASLRITIGPRGRSSLKHLKASEPFIEMPAFCTHRFEADADCDARTKIFYAYCGYIARSLAEGDVEGLSSMSSGEGNPYRIAKSLRSGEPNASAIFAGDANSKASNSCNEQ